MKTLLKFLCIVSMLCSTAQAMQEAGSDQDCPALPTEVWCNIIVYIPKASDLAAMARTCTLLRACTTQPLRQATVNANHELARCLQASLYPGFLNVRMLGRLDLMQKDALLCAVVAVGNRSEASTCLVRLLLRAGANPNVCCVAGGGHPALYVAVSRGFPDVVRLLVKHGASLADVVHEQTPLQVARANMHRPEMVDIYTILHEAEVAVVVARLRATKLGDN